MQGVYFNSIDLKSLGRFFKKFRDKAISHIGA